MTNEHALLAQWISGRNEEAFHGIVRRYSGLVYASCLRVLRNEADAQEAALDAFLALSQLKRVPDAPLGAWLHRTAVHRAIDRFRKTQTRTRYESALAREAATETTAFGWDDISGLIDEAVAALPEDLRQAVVGHFFEGKTHAELADAAGLSRPAITKRVHQGVEGIRSSLLRKGVTVGSVAALTLLLTEHAVASPAVPAALAASLGKLAVSGFTATGAAAGASLGLAAKALIAAVVLSIVAGVGYTFLPDIAKRNMALLRVVPKMMVRNEWHKMFPPAPTTAKAATAPIVPAAAKSAEEAVSGEAGVAVTGTLESAMGSVPGEADIVMEKVTWAPTDMPPAQMEKRFGKANSAGQFIVENVPPGEWSAAVFGAWSTGGGSLTIKPGAVVPPPQSLKVYPGEPCSGVLVDEAGAPVPGAVLYPVGHELAPDDEFGHMEIAAFHTLTDDQGHFSFRYMIPGGMKYFIVAPGHAPQYSDFVKTSDGGTTIRLRPLGRVRGRVVTEGAVAGMEGITLRLSAGKYDYDKTVNERTIHVRRGRIEKTVTTGRDGTFLAEDLPEAKYRVEMPEGAAWVIPASVGTDVHSSQESAVTVRLEQGCTLFGRVIDAQTGESLGAGVELWLSGGNQDKPTVTDAEGNYRFDNLSRGARTVNMNGPLVANGKRSVIYARPGEYQPVWEVEVKSGETEKDFLIDRCRIHGMVTDASNMPVAGAEVFGSDSGSDMNILTRTGSDGRFDMRCVRSLYPPLHLKAEKDGWRGLQMAAIVPGGETEVNVKLAYPSRGEVSGVAVRSNGAPVAGMVLSCSAIVTPDGKDENRMYARGETTVAADGTFTLTGLVPGAYDFYMRGERDFHALHAKDKITLTPDEKLADVRLEFAEIEEHVLAGTVLDETGSPIAQCRVSSNAGNTATATGADGRFRFTVKTSETNPATYFTADGYADYRESLAVEKTDNVITLKKLRRLFGNVTDEDGAPVTAFTMEVSGRAGGYANIRKIVSDAAGAFDFADMPAPPADMVVTADGYGRHTEEVMGDEYENPVRIVLHPAVLLEGTVVDESRKPLAGCRVECNGAEFITDGNGHFSTDKAAVGAQCDIVVLKPTSLGGYMFAWKGSVTAPANVECVLGPAGSIKLNVMLDGTPLADPALSSGHCSAHTDRQTENGLTVHYELEHDPKEDYLYATTLPAGPVQLHVHMGSLEQYGPAVCEKVVDVQVIPNDSTEVEVNFETPAAPAATQAAVTDPATPGVTEE
jgi:RNA polymerase sigma factor (sigma-70 family)